MHEVWPDVPYGPWRETCSALHLYVQIIGKYRLARTPWVNHSWHATLYPSARGLTTGPVPDNGAAIEFALDLVAHRFRGSSSTGLTVEFAMEPMSVATFHARMMEAINRLGGTPEFDGRPSEIANGEPFAEDRAERPYDADAVNRFFRALTAAAFVMERFRTGYLGKVSPVHLFWGSFDLAVTRFSGRRAPLHPGGIPALPDAVTREAYSHEVSSAGFWPGGGSVVFPAFYSYAYPAPAGYPEAPVEPSAAFFHQGLGEFVLPYESVRTAADPEATLMSFLETTYRAAARLGNWDEDALECAVGQPLKPRLV